MKEIVCFCKKISKQEIEDAAKNGATSLDEIKKVTGACTGNNCKEMNPKGRCCSGDIFNILKNRETILSQTNC
jgi:bacterioferritin-associated ferredoxin